MSRDGSVLVNVNAGSNTISAFAVTPRGLRLIGTASSGGTNPNSVTIAGDNVVYVLNASYGDNRRLPADPGRLGPIPHSVQPTGVGALVLRLHRERGQRLHRPLRRRARRHPHRPRHHADRERPEHRRPHEEGVSADQNYLYVLAQGLSQIVGYRVGADGSLTQVTTVPVAAGSVRRRRQLRPPATVIHRPRDAETKVLPHPAGI